MKKLTVLLAGLLCIMNLVVAVGETQITHSASCSVAHEDFVMIDESSADFDTDLTRQICGGYWGSSKTKIALFPSHAKDGMKLIELTTIKPLEGGFAGIFYLSEDSQLELIIIPDTYRSSSYLAPLAGKLQYVALPSNDRFTVSERNDMMFNDHIGLTFLVVEGSAAHEYCVEKNLPHVFRKEYCHYVNENGVFDSEMFYQDIPNMINSSEEAAQSGSPISIAKNNLTASAAEIMYPYIDGTMWGFLDADGNTLIQPQYSSADCGNAGIYIVEVGTHFGLIDSYGMTLLPIEYDSIEYIADNVYFVKKSSKNFIVHPIDGEVIDISAYSDVFHLGDGLIQYFEKVRTSAGIQYYTGLLGYDGSVLCEPADASYVHYPERGLIGVSFSGDNAGAKIIDYAGKTYVDFVAGGWMMPTIEVPTMQISSGHTVVETVVYFENAIQRLKIANGLRHCGAFEGYIDGAGNYYPINQKPENGTYVYIAFAQKDDANNIIIYSNGYQLPYEVFSFPTSKYGSYTNNVSTHNGFGVIASKHGVPFYVCTDITGREMTDAMNHAIFTFTHDNHYSHITLHPVNDDGIGLAEVQELDGSCSFMTAQLNPITHDETWYPITMQTRKGSVRAISPYQFGHAVIYDDSGKAGIVNARGQIITDMIYDHIILYDRYAIGITGDVLYPASYSASDVVVIDDMPYSKQFSVSGYGDSIIDEEIIVRNGTTQVIEYTN